MYILKYRTENNLTRAELAKQLGCSHSLIQHIESGLRSVTPKKAKEWEKITNGGLPKELTCPEIFGDAA